MIKLKKTPFILLLVLVSLSLCLSLLTLFKTHQVSEQLSNVSEACVVNIIDDYEGSYWVGDSLSTSSFLVQANGYPINIDLSRNNTSITAPSLTTEFPTVFTLHNNPGNIQFFFDEEEITTDSFEVQFDSLSLDTTHSIRIKQNGCERSYTFTTLPSNFPTIEFTGTSNSQGDYYGDLMNDYDTSYVFKMNSDGKLTYYYGGYYEQYGSVMNFQKHSINGTTYYSFFEPDVDKEHLLYYGVQYGHINLMNDRYEIIRQIRLLPTDTIPDGGEAENHDFLLLDENHWLITGSVDANINVEGINDDARVKYAYVQEVKDETVIFEWSSLQDKGMLAASKENNDYTNTNDVYYAADYAHINSISIDPLDDNIIISFRNQDAVKKISHETGETIWTLGGDQDDFHISSTQQFSRQHYAKKTADGTLLLFDNGNDRQQTRILEFTLDEDTKTITDFSELAVEGKWSMATGSVVKTSNGNYVIGWGYGSVHSLMSEINSTTHDVVCEMIPEANQYSYRVVKFE